jgi:hypothetical protein
MRTRLGPSQRSGCQRPARPLSERPPRRRRSSAAGREPAWDCRRLDRETDVLLDVELHAIPRRVRRGGEAGVGQRVQIGLELLVRAHLRQARLRHRQKSFGRDPPRDVLRLVVEVEELLHSVLVAALLERHQIVFDPERDGLANGRWHLGDAVAHLLLGIELRGQRAEADHHAHLAVLEELKRAVGAIGLARIDLGDSVPVGEVGEELQGLQILVAVDRPRVAGLPVAAVVPHPDRPLGLRFLGPERQRVADDAAAEPLDLAGGLYEFVPGLGRRRQARSPKQVLVVEEGPGARENRKAVELALILAAAGERPDEVVARPGRQHLLGGVEKLIPGVARERIQVEHVGPLIVLDHRAHLLIDRVPVDDPQIDLHAGLLRVLFRQALPEGLRVVLAVVGDHDRDRLGGGRLFGAPIAGAERHHSG